MNRMSIVTCRLLCHLVGDMTWQGEGGDGRNRRFSAFCRSYKTWSGLSALPSNIVVQFVAPLKPITFSDSHRGARRHPWCHRWLLWYLSPARRGRGRQPGNARDLAGFQGAESKVKCQRQGVLAGFAGWNTTRITHLLHFHGENAKIGQRGKQQEECCDGERQCSNTIKVQLW